MEWYYEKRGGQMGPVPEEELIRLHENGVVTDSTLIWREGMTGWQPWRTAGPVAAPVIPTVNQGERVLPKAFAKARCRAAIGEAVKVQFSGKGGMIVLALFVSMLIFQVAQFIPLVSLAAVVFTFVHLGGAFWYALRQVRGESPPFSDIFAGYTRNMAQLILLGVIYLGVSLLAVVAGAVVFFVLNPSIISEITNSGELDPDSMPTAMLGAILLISLPLIYFQFSTMLASTFMIDRYDGVTAGLRNSFVAIHQNFGSFILWAVTSALATALLPVLIIGASAMTLQGSEPGAMFILALIVALVLYGLGAAFSLILLMIMYRNMTEGLPGLAPPRRTP